MIDLWLIIIASLNTLLLFLLNKKFPYNSGEKEKRKIFSLHIDDGLAFINTLSRDFLMSIIFTHLLLFNSRKHCLMDYLRHSYCC